VKRRLLSAAAGLLALAGVLFLWARSHPLDANDLVLGAKLRLAGVRRLESGGLSALVRDSCSQGQECRCVALVHGLGDSAETWDRILLDEEGAPFPRGVKVYAPNLPGTEGSAAPASPEGYRTREMAGALRSTLEPVCPRWTVAGNSLGGWVAAWLAADWPEGVERLILLAPAGLDDPTGLSEETARTLADPTPEAIQAFLGKAQASPAAFPKAVLKQIAGRIRSRPSKSMVLAIRKEEYLDESLSAVRAPTLVLWGEADRVIPPSQGPKFQKGIQGSRLELLPNCGHLPQKECPAAVRKAVFGP